ncbi:hypothetical protein EVAR_18920_1 [Eumeta japonica]|uniref:Uncharacterized protein n=1 Tax=Eumeta variegata TaxID=151549 RepID=A0A4C1V3B2_EUMVA|nr:hypothetical protein EVAR_18920_1 [Eumeta japonica]
MSNEIRSRTLVSDTGPTYNYSRVQSKTSYFRRERRQRCIGRSATGDGPGERPPKYRQSAMSGSSRPAGAPPRRRAPATPPTPARPRPPRPPPRPRRAPPAQNVFQVISWQRHV